MHVNDMHDGLRRRSPGSDRLGKLSDAQVPRERLAMPAELRVGCCCSSYGSSNGSDQ
jgi:hypothetical protein